MSYVTFDNEYLKYNDEYLIQPSTLTLLTDGNGTLSAETLIGMPGDTVTLVPKHNTYYRFKDYDITGGSIIGNTFTFGIEDATVQANFKENYFTASGGFLREGNVFAQATTKSVPENYNVLTHRMLYGVMSACTGDIPSSWTTRKPTESASRPPRYWRPSNAHNYSITANPKMEFAASATGAGGNSRASYTAYTIMAVKQGAYNEYGKFAVESARTLGTGHPSAYRWYYSPTVTGDNPALDLGISADLSAYGSVSATCMYIASGTTGTWTATGIAP